MKMIYENNAVYYLDDKDYKIYGKLIKLKDFFNSQNIKAVFHLNPFLKTNPPKVVLPKIKSFKQFFSIIRLYLHHFPQKSEEENLVSCTLRKRGREIISAYRDIDEFHFYYNGVEKKCSISLLKNIPVTVQYKDTGNELLSV
ncbi:MAG: hypothetical protein RMI01_10180 [Thermodesulfovibrio sp.]|nr:hypothetical protein [Thermodesulfovibrio sp.]